MQEEMHRCAREGTPRPESSAVRAHVPAAFWAFADSWKAIFHSGVVRPRDQGAVPGLHLAHGEVRVLRQPALDQGDERRASQEMQYDDLLNFESLRPVRRPAEGRARLRPGDRLGRGRPRRAWDRLHAHFTEAELVELGCFIALTFGQQSWIRLLGIDHHQYLAGTDASMAPGFRTAEELAESKARTTTGPSPAPHVLTRRDLHTRGLIGAGVQISCAPVRQPLGGDVTPRWGAAPLRCHPEPSAHLWSTTRVDTPHGAATSAHSARRTRQRRQRRALGESDV